MARSDRACDVGRQLPGNCKFHFNYATTVEKTPENAAQREHHFKRAVEIYPQYTEAWTNLGTLLASQSRFSEALDSWHNAVTRGRDVVGGDKGMAATNAVMASVQTGQIALAKQWLRKAERLRPDFSLWPPAALHARERWKQGTLQ